MTSVDGKKGAGTPTRNVTRKNFLKGLAGAGGCLAIAGRAQGREEERGEAMSSARFSVAPSGGKRRPNILFIMTDQERGPACLPESLSLPGHDMLRARGVAFRNFNVTTTPCSPSRSVIYTGRHTRHTGVVTNPGTGFWKDLSPGIPTIGHMLREQGYYTAYKGKWHLSDIAVPSGTALASFPTTERALEPYGFSDYMLMGDPLGDPWSGFRDDPVILSEAVHWLRDRRPALPEGQPWFLAVNFVNPHDIMFFDAGAGQQATRLRPNLLRPLRPAPTGWPYEEDLGYPLPPSFAAVMEGDPARQTWAHRAFARRNADLFGTLAAPGDADPWRTFQNSYFNCLRDVDQHVAALVTALEASGEIDNTVIVYTSDHGEMAGAHGLTQKGPVAYRENINVPFILCHPEGARGVQTDSLGTALDIAPTLLEYAGVPPEDIARRYPDLRGISLADVGMGRGGAGPRDDRGGLIYFGVTNWFDPDQLQRVLAYRDAVAAGETPPRPGGPSLNNPALFRALVTQRYTFARYFRPSEHHRPADWRTLIRHNELELYDRQTDPGETVNLAHGKRAAAHRELISALNAQLNAAIDAEVGTDDGAEFPGTPERYRLGG